MKKLFLLATFAITSIISAQEQRIMIVEDNLAEFGEFDKYNLNTYTKQFFEADGFKVYFEKDLPKELVNNRCSATFVNYKDNSGMFSTKLVMQIKDCTGKVIFTSDEGMSKEKTYVTAYRQALLNATKSYRIKKGMIDFDSAYNLASENTLVANNTNTNLAIQNKKNIVNDAKLNFEFLNGKSTGYIKNANGEILYNITKTSIDNLYTASNKYVDGIVFLKDGKWYFEFTKNDEKITEEIK